MQLHVHVVLDHGPLLVRNVPVLLDHAVQVIRRVRLDADEVHEPVEGSLVAVHGDLDALVLVHVLDHVGEVRHIVPLLHPVPVQKHFLFLLVIATTFDYDFDKIEVERLVLFPFRSIHVLGQCWHFTANAYNFWCRRLRLPRRLDLLFLLYELVDKRLRLRLGLLHLRVLCKRRGRVLMMEGVRIVVLLLEQLLENRELLQAVGILRLSSIFEIIFTGE